MRLTRNQEKFWGKGNYKGEKYIIGSNGVTSKQMCLNKLGKIEDLEEEIGCPLDVVFKALKDGIYTKDLPREELSKQFVRLSNVETEWYLINMIMCVNLKDYKNTWWLREDKSE